MRFWNAFRGMEDQLPPMAAFINSFETWGSQKHGCGELWRGCCLRWRLNFPAKGVGVSSLEANSRIDHGGVIAPFSIIAIASGLDSFAIFTTIDDFFCITRPDRPRKHAAAETDIRTVMSGAKGRINVSGSASKVGGGRPQVNVWQEDIKARPSMFKRPSITTAFNLTPLSLARLLPLRTHPNNTNHSIQNDRQRFLRQRFQVL